jgi:hypothetical protein
MSFLANFDPARGDVIYGISPARTVYRSAWYDDHMQHINNTTLPTDPHFMAVAALGWHQMDEYNNYFGIPTTSTSGSGAGMRAHLQTRSAAAPLDPMASKNTQRVKQYQSQLVTSRYSPESVYQTSRAKLASEGYAANQFSDPRNALQKLFGTAKSRSSATQALEQNRNYLAIRRACKFGIGLVATGDQFQNALVHFVLDGLNMQEVATKATRQSQTGTQMGTKTFVSITVSELRYVYRNWGQLSAKVVLYVNLQPVAAPWIANWGPIAAHAGIGGTVSAEKALWDQYGADRAVKYPGGLPNKSLI